MLRGCCRFVQYVDNPDVQHCGAAAIGNLASGSSTSTLRTSVLRLLPHDVVTALGCRVAEECQDVFASFGVVRVLINALTVHG